MRPKVHTEKHMQQHSLATIAAGAITTISSIIAVAVPSSSVTQVREGSTISAIYTEIWGTTDDAASGTVIVTVEKTVAGQTDMTTAQAAALNSYPNKKNILHTMMGLTPPDLQYPMPLLKGWIRIPKGKQRFSLGDELHINIFAQSNGVAFCGFTIFKEQY